MSISLGFWWFEYCLSRISGHPSLYNRLGLGSSQPTLVTCKESLNRLCLCLILEGTPSCLGLLSWASCMLLIVGRLVDTCTRYPYGRVPEMYIFVSGSPPNLLVPTH